MWPVAGLNRFSVLWDIIHGLDMGPTMHVNGNVLYDLTANTNLGANKQSRLQWAFARIRQAYNDLGIENYLDALTLSMFTDPDSPGTVFIVRKVKANTSRYVLAALLEVLKHPHTYEPGEYAACKRDAVTDLCRILCQMQQRQVLFARTESANAYQETKNFSGLLQLALRMGPRTQCDALANHHLVPHAQLWCCPSYIP